MKNKGKQYLVADEVAPLSYTVTVEELMKGHGVHMDGPQQAVRAEDIEKAIRAVREGGVKFYHTPAGMSYPEAVRGIRFQQAWTYLAEDIHNNAKDKGWWDTEKKVPEELLLLHAEVSEATEAMRKGNPPDSHIPEFTGLEAELADVVIRIMDIAEGMNLRVSEAIIAKHEYNKGRSHRHGGKLF